MKKTIITVSLPEETKKLLKVLVSPRKRSAFIAEAINEALDEKRNALRAAYREAQDDPGRKEVIEDWSVLDGEDWEDEEIS